MIKVSVIVPIYNMEQYLRQCLDSLVRQTLEEKEIICIDDGSQDSSINIIREYSQIFSFIEIIQQENQGVANARNKGIDIAKGEYIAFVDPDDYYPDHEVLSCLYNNAKRENVAICGGSFSSSYYGNLKTVYDTGYTFYEDRKMEFLEYQWDYGYHRFIYDKNMLVKHNIYFPLYRRYQDPPFLVRAMLQAKEFYGLKKITYCYRIGHQNIIWSVEKSIDLLKGIRDNLKISNEFGLEKLHCNTLVRLDNYYNEAIKQHVESKNQDITFLLNEIKNYISKEVLSNNTITMLCFSEYTEV